MPDCFGTSGRFANITLLDNPIGIATSRLSACKALGYLDSIRLVRYNWGYSFQSRTTGKAARDGVFANSRRTCVWLMVHPTR